MTIKPILTIPDPFLRKKCKHIDTIDDDIKTLAQDMIETMHHAAGIGLSANQIGVGVRLIVVDLGSDLQPGGPLIMVNPMIQSAATSFSTYNEGCLSVPDQYADVSRPESVIVQWQDLDNNTQTMEADNLMATCIQHEIDHLNGKVFLDYLTPVRRNIITRKVKKIVTEQNHSLNV